MDGRMSPIRVQHEWNSAGGKPVCHITWTNEQLHQIAQAVQEGDETFLATVEAAIRQALDAALLPQAGREFRRAKG